MLLKRGWWYVMVWNVDIRRVWTQGDGPTAAAGDFGGRAPPNGSSKRINFKTVSGGGFQSLSLSGSERGDHGGNSSTPRHTSLPPMFRRPAFGSAVCFVCFAALDLPIDFAGSCSNWPEILFLHKYCRPD